MTESLIRAAKLIREADLLLIGAGAGAGAGIGVDSGLPDFRGTEGFWRAYPKAAELGWTFLKWPAHTTFRLTLSLPGGFTGIDSTCTAIRCRIEGFQS